VSFIKIESPASASRVVMAIWFRVPQKTITAARAEWRAIVAAIEASSTPDSIPIPSMVGVIPLVTFGPRTLNGKKSKSIILNSKTTFSQEVRGVVSS
jgi:hypothetical protein